MRVDLHQVKFRHSHHHTLIGLRYTPNWIERFFWVIVGGESGHGARPMDPAWARSLRDQCQAAGIPFFFKQWGKWFPFELEAYAANDKTRRDAHRVITKAVPNGAIRFVRGYGKQRILDKKEWNQFPKP